jgi:serine/threonine protein kinase/tetratricopeptide (TPR) repeat protein
MPAEPMQVKALFLAAAALQPAQRAAFLEQACGTDAELRQRIEQLLSAHDEPGSQPAPPGQTVDEVSASEDGDSAAPPDPGPAEEIGSVVAGRYKLLQVIGEGGMGSVFMAEQKQPVKRMVALKVVKAGMDSRSVLARFEAERQALALMDHPNIAKVLDAGSTERGQPFFAMELVKGIPLTAFCDERQLSVNDRLLIFQQICQAVQHAHQKGIIHRDLKPSNILVESHDGRAVPKIIDFGLAKAMSALPLTERSLFTNFGAMLGTPLYMAPEQAEFSAIDVDTRADIYALGVILYELLTGTTPLEKKRLAKAAWDEVRRVIKEEEPPKPSTRLSTSEAKASIAAQRQSEPHRLGKFLRGDLDWIVMKALAKERDRRYDTANAFAADVERFLRHEPVSAGPPTVAYKLRKFVRRNRAGVVVAVTMAGLLLLGGVGLVIGLVAIRAEQQRTAEALAQVTAEQARTQQALAAETKARKQTREALNAMTDDVIQKLFARQPTLGDNERAFLHKVVGFYQAFAAEKGETEEARAVAADGQFRVAYMRAFLGERNEAIPGYREAIRLMEKLVADFPTVPAYRQGLAKSHNELGILLRDLGKRREAEAAYRQALAIRQQLVDDVPSEPNYLRDLAQTYNDLGILFYDQHNLSQAEEAYRKALDIRVKLAAKPSTEVNRWGVAQSHSNLCLVLQDQGKFAQAETACRKALEIRTELATDFPSPESRQTLAVTWNNLGTLLEGQGKITDAEEAYRQAVEIDRKQVAEFPSMPEYRWDLARPLSNLGALLWRLGRYPEAVAALDESQALLKKLAGDFPRVPKYRQDLAGAYLCLSLVLAAQGKGSQAEDTIREAIRVYEKLAADFPNEPAYLKEVANSHHARGTVLRKQGKLPQAEVAYREALANQEKLAVEYPKVRVYSQALAGTCGDLGDLLMSQKRPEESLEWYGKAIPLLEANLAQGASVVRSRLILRGILRGRARALTDLHRYPEALQDWARAIELEQGPAQRGLRLQRAGTLAQAGDHAKAVAEADEVTRDNQTPGSMLYNAACVYGLSVPVVKGDAKLQDQYAAKALALLRRAQEAGFFKGAAEVENLQKDDDLAALRDREDFKQFVRDLQTKLMPPQPKR